MANLFVRNLSYSATDASLKDFFEQIAPVKDAHIVTDRDTKRSKGFGFVEFEDESSNDEAIKSLDGKEFDNRAINVSIARPREDKPRRNNFDNRKNNGGSFRRRSW